MEFAVWTSKLGGALGLAAQVPAKPCDHAGHGVAGGGHVIHPIEYGEEGWLAFDVFEIGLAVGKREVGFAADIRRWSLDLRRAAAVKGAASDVNGGLEPILHASHVERCNGALRVPTHTDAIGIDHLVVVAAHRIVLFEDPGERRAHVGGAETCWSRGDYHDPVRGEPAEVAVVPIGRGTRSGTPHEDRMFQAVLAHLSRAPDVVGTRGVHLRLERPVHLGGFDRRQDAPRGWWLRVHGTGLGVVHGAGLGVHGAGLGVHGTGLGVHGTGLGVHGTGLHGARLGVHGARLRLH